MNQYSENYIPVTVGRRYYHKTDGWYEIIKILPNKRYIVRFDNTGGTVEACKTAVMYQRISDPLGNRFYQVGERLKNKYGDWFTIIKRVDRKKVVIRFDNTGTEVEVYVNNMKNGNVKDFCKPIINNVGYIGRKRSLANKKSHSYVVWRNLISRCYNDNIQLKHPTYKDCSVCKEWHNFTVFEEWFNKHYINGYCLDKDILYKGNKLYSPKTCCFVPNEINALFTKRQNNRGNFPIGVQHSKWSTKFKTAFTRGTDRCFVGCFNTPEEAFIAYKREKEAYIKEVASKWKGKIAENVYEAMMKYEVEITD